MPCHVVALRTIEPFAGPRGWAISAVLKIKRNSLRLERPGGGGNKSTNQSATLIVMSWAL